MKNIKKRLFNLVNLMNLKTIYHHKRNFTLVELIIVIVTIGLLAGMAMPKFIGIQKNAEVVAMKTDLNVLENAVQQYMINTDDGIYPFEDLNTDGKINEKDRYFKVESDAKLRNGSIPETLKESLYNLNEDDGTEIYKLNMDKLKPYIQKLKYKDTEYLYSLKSESAIDLIGKVDNKNNTYHIIGNGFVRNKDDEVIKDIDLSKNMKSSYYHVLSIGTDGNLYAWGNNQYGQLGFGDTNNQFTPKKVELPNGIKPKEIASMDVDVTHSMIIGSDGNLYAWGDGHSGQLGNGSYENLTKPTLIHLPNDAKPKIVKLGLFYSMVIADDGNLYVTGENGNSELGISGVMRTSTFQKVTFPNNIKPIDIFIEYRHSIVIGNDGNLYSWGRNYYGEVGQGLVALNPTPLKVILPIGVKPKDISTNKQYTMIIGTDNNIYGCGRNSNGQLGLDNVLNQSYPQVGILPEGVMPKKLYTSIWTTFMIGDDGNLYGWGYNEYGQLGDGTYEEKHKPIKIDLPNGIKPKKVFLNNLSTIVMGTDDQLYGFGSNYYGEIGLDKTTEKTNIPTLIKLPNGIKPISVHMTHNGTFVFCNDNNIYAFGGNTYGKLGTGNQIDQFGPIKINFN